MVGSNSVQLVFENSFPYSNRSYVEELFRQVYPTILPFYGPPSSVVTVAIAYKGGGDWNWYFPSNATGMGKILMSSLPLLLAGDTNQTWDNLFVHELIHAFHDTISIKSSWIEEGMTEAATALVADYLQSSGVRNLQLRTIAENIRMYDCLGYMGADVLGGTTWSGSKTMPFDTLYRAAPALFLILASRLDWNLTRTRFLLKLNEALYEESDRTGSRVIDDSTFLVVLREVVGHIQMEGQDVIEWVRQQPVALTNGTSGPHIGMYVLSPDAPWQLVVLAFDRVGGVERPLVNLNVTVRVINSTGAESLSRTVTTSSRGVGYLPLGGISEGGYIAIAETTASNVQLKAMTYFLSRSVFWDLTSNSTLFGVSVGPGLIPTTGDLGTDYLDMNYEGAFALSARALTPSGEVRFPSDEGHLIYQPELYPRVVLVSVSQSLSHAVVDFSVSKTVISVEEPIAITAKWPASGAFAVRIETDGVSWSSYCASSSGKCVVNWQFYLPGNYTITVYWPGGSKLAGAHGNTVMVRVLSVPSEPKRAIIPPDAIEAGVTVAVILTLFLAVTIAQKRLQRRKATHRDASGSSVETKPRLFPKAKHRP